MGAVLKRGSFHTTRWSRVMAARGASTEAQIALAALCEAYYEPVQAYIAYTTRDLGDPRDLTHAFFARILAGAALAGAEPRRGRFRSYLLGAVKNFLSETRQRAQAAKRGDGLPPLSLHSGTPTDPGFEMPAAKETAPDAWFDRRWGLALLQRALDTLGSEHQARGDTRHFTQLKPWLTGEAIGQSQADLAADLGMSEGAVKVAIHRLRKRFREIVQAHILETVSTEEEMREELRYLIDVVG
jgi:DNA-directed RNA polymerase specialized sigma24 family protein